MNYQKMATNNRLRRFLLSAAAIILISATLLLASCDGGGTETDPPQTSATVPESTPEESTAEATTPPEATTEEPKPDEPVVKKAVIWGGGAGTKIYKAAFELVDKKNPKVIVLCTAGKDNVSNVTSYVNSMRAFSKNVEAITLCTKLYDPQELHDKITGADLIIVGGGQSEFMLDTWKEFKVDEYLIEAYNKGVVCVGGSAGGMCWTYAGWNDFYGLPDSEYKFFYGLDVVPIYYGPHLDSSSLWAQFLTEMPKIKDPKYNIGYAMDNGAALVFIDNVAVKSVREAGSEHIYTFSFADGKWTKTEYKYD